MVTRPVTLTVGPQGRIVIPAAIRRELAVSPGDELSATVDDGRLVLTSKAAALARLHGMYAHLTKDGVSVVDELIAERRAEAARED